MYDGYDDKVLTRFFHVSLPLSLRFQQNTANIDESAYVDDLI